MTTLHVANKQIVMERTSLYCVRAVVYVQGGVRDIAEIVYQ